MHDDEKKLSHLLDASNAIRVAFVQSFRSSFKYFRLNTNTDNNRDRL